MSPSHVWILRGPKWQKQPVPCKVCRQCRWNRVNDYIGRSLCEAAYSDWTAAVTLTYRDCVAREEDLAHRVITPRHFQDFVRALRKRGHSIRYLASGEVGSLNGRTHFHALLFGRGVRWQIPHGENFWDDVWPHGHLFADLDSDEKAARYTCKYLLKDVEDEDKPSWFTLSKKPALGAAFFAAKADELVAASALPTGFNYMPPNGLRQRQYMMTGATRRDYLMRVISGVIANRSIDRKTLNEWVLKSLQKYELTEIIKDLERRPVEQQFEDFQNYCDLIRPTQRQTMDYLFDIGRAMGDW